MRRLLFLFLFITANAFAQTVTWTNTHQTIDGFGSETLDFANSLTSSQADQFFLSTGSGNNIGLSIVRTANRAAGSGSIPDLVTLQEAVARGALLELSLQSPPASIKTSGSFNTGTINGESCIAATQSTNYTTYATYIVNYINTMSAAVGHRVDYLDVQNEPNISSSSYGACLWTASGLDNFIKTYLGPALSGASWNSTQQTSPLVMMPSSSNWESAGPDLSSTCLNDSSCSQYVDITGYHGYGVAATGAGISDYALGRAGGTCTLGTTGCRHMWMSETDYQCGSFTFDASMTNALVTAQSLHNYLTTASVSGWEYWELIYAASSGNCGLWDDSFNIAKRFYVNGNWSKFVRPGWVRIDSTNPVSGVLITAFKDPIGGGFAIVAVNTNGSTSSPTITFSGFPSITNNQLQVWTTSSSQNLVNTGILSPSGSTLSVTLPASSVTTFVGSTGSAPPWTGVIASNRAIDWRYAGLPGDSLPSVNWPNCTTVQAGTTMPIPAYTGTSATIENAMIACHAAVPTGVKVQLASGTFLLSNGIDFPADTIGHIAIVGQGPVNTKLNMTGSGCTYAFGNAYICAKSSDSSPTLVTGTNVNPHVVTIVSGFAKGSTQLQLNSISTIVVGSVLGLNQCDTGYSPTGLGTACTGSSVDNNGYFWCQDTWSSAGHGCAVPGESSTVGYRVHGAEEEPTVVTAINQGGCGATCVTISKPIENPDWSTAQGVQAVVLQPNPYIGIENLSINATGGTAARGVYYEKVLHGWISGVVITNTTGYGIWYYDSFGSLIKDSYFYGTGLTGTGDRDAFHITGGGNHIIQNNIIHNARGCAFFADAIVEHGDVYAYNYCVIPGRGTPGLPSTDNHGVSSFYLLEGNIMYGWDDDGDHGNHLSSASFRNLYTGWLSCAAVPNPCGGGSPGNHNNPGQNNGNGQIAGRIFYGTRYGFYGDNALGTPGYTSLYNSNGFESDLTVFMISGTQLGMPIDPLILQTTMFWGNWDTVHGSSQFNNSEVPTAAPTYPNSVPSSHATPPSFYLNSRPTWFGSKPFPLIGHDVTSGNVGVCGDGTSANLNVVGKFNGLPATNTSQCAGSALTSAWGNTVNSNPAMSYYLLLGGVPDGTGPQLTAFDPSFYYSGGTIPVASLTPPSMSFTAVQNNTSPGQTATLTNTGTANLIVSNVVVSSFFSNTNTGTCAGTSFTLAPSASCTIIVTFSPNAIGPFSGTLSVSDNASGSPHTIALSGTGTGSVIVWNPTTYPFGSQLVSTPVDSSPILLSNTGTVTLNVSLTFSGANPSLFTVSNTTCSSTLIAGGTCSVTVRFTPTSVASFTANLVETDSSQAISQSVALSGSGVSTTIVAAPCPWCLI